jgi:lysophospholipase L1-like esterase
MAAAVALLSVAALLGALAVTPPSVVTAFGQDLALGAVSPTALRGVSGPGQADLFGEGPVDTTVVFEGPIRPRLVWTRFNRNDAASQFIQTTDSGGRPTLRTSELGSLLADGWIAYLGRLVLVAGALGGGLYLVGIGLTALVASGALTLTSARDRLAQVSALSDLIGTARLAPPPAPSGPTRSDVDVVVVGDSTAAGVGNGDLVRPSSLDTTCGRSRDAYAQVLQSATGHRVLNLACSSATLDSGVLGAQVEGTVVVPPQIGVLKAITSVRTVILSVGANDVGWSDFLQLCYALTRCDDTASEQLFRSRLDTFRLQYAQLLEQLSALPSRPQVLVTDYYDPFGTTFDCAALSEPNEVDSLPAGAGFAADPGGIDQEEKVRRKVDPLRSELAAINTVLAQGAEAFGFVAVHPSFDGHALCSDQPWVQGLRDRYAFHPNAAGELAIAAALLPHLAGLVPSSG